MGQEEQDAEGGEDKAAYHGNAQGRRLVPAFRETEAMGIIPAIIATLVIRIGLSRWPAASRCTEAAPERRSSSAFVIKSTELAMATPTAMIAPIYDWMFKVLPVIKSRKSDPAITAGITDKVANATRKDWKKIAMARKITTMATINPNWRLWSVCWRRSLCPRRRMRAPLGSLPMPAMMLRTFA